MSDSSYYTNQYNDTNGLLPNGNYSQASSNSTSSPKEPLYTGTQNYSGFAYSEFTPENQPQPSIPFTFEAPTRSRRRRRQPSFPTREAQQEDFDFPQPRSYQLNPPGLSDGSPAMSQTEKGQLISALRNNQIKTLVELRRVEKSFINSGDYDLRDAVAASWGYYVNSNNLLNELRTLTRSYPFASECLDEAKWKCTEDPNSGRSWNYCWLVLVKVQNEGLIAKHANWMASKPEMWGNTRPNAAAVAQLAANFSVEWTRAVAQLLRHWESPPTTTGA